jgi:hypothetical protein
MLLYAIVAVSSSIAKLQYLGGMCSVVLQKLGLAVAQLEYDPNYIMHHFVASLVDLSFPRLEQKLAGSSSLVHKSLFSGVNLLSSEVRVPYHSCHCSSFIRTTFISEEHCAWFNLNLSVL